MFWVWLLVIAGVSFKTSPTLGCEEKTCSSSHARTIRKVAQQILFPNQLSKPTPCRLLSAGSRSCLKRCTQLNCCAKCEDARSLVKARRLEVNICAACLFAPRPDLAAQSSATLDYHCLLGPMCPKCSTLLSQARAAQRCESIHPINGSVDN